MVFLEIFFAWFLFVLGFVNLIKESARESYAFITGDKNWNNSDRFFATLRAIFIALCLGGAWYILFY